MKKLIISLVVIGLVAYTAFDTANNVVENAVSEKEQLLKSI